MQDKRRVSEIIEDLKQRFLTLETAEGTTLIVAGLGVLAGHLFGLLPYIGMILFGLGFYKTFVKR